MTNTISQKYIDFSKTVTKMANELGLNRFSMSMTPNYDDEWRDRIDMNWESGRHGDESENIRLQSTVQVFAKVKYL